MGEEIMGGIHCFWGECLTAMKQKRAIKIIFRFFRRLNPRTHDEHSGNAERVVPPAINDPREVTQTPMIGCECRVVDPTLDTHSLLIQTRDFLWRLGNRCGTAEGL